MALDGVSATCRSDRSDAKIEFINRDDPRALELIRHDAAHVLAEACSRCGRARNDHRPGDRERGFITTSSDEPFTPEDFAAIEKRCARSSPAANRLRKKSAAASSKQVFLDNGEMFKVELVRDPGDQTIKIYRQGAGSTSAAGAHDATGKVGTRSSS